ncbi:MAG: tRNA uridine-5-carboxymethylaminomethyl(34) synthesis enzyme MnmG [Cyclobacteriaceae bacterium]|nr:tRNA uridine-5-carboxymethylaminomethyl(34) synthesis enzyme MnmG [Cyclobacteriaceae bacterium]
MFPEYDVIVVGAGHAGCEAAHAAAAMGSKVMLVTMNMMTIAQMSCNPAMGGIAKGQIIREIDALGGMSGIVSDKSTIQFRMLNKSKGPAMWSPRSQNDRNLFSQYWREALEANPNVDIWQDMVNALLLDGNKVKGVKTNLGIEIIGKSVVLTNGTFLNGLIHIGEKRFGGGRTAERAATGITEQLIQLGFEAGRMKTGTPPRLDGRSINYAILEEQKGDEDPEQFSFLQKTNLPTQRSCYITYTNQKVHEILEKGFDQSPLFTGRIKGIGPRYCPSIEDKINRFAERERHQLFVEPEGWNTVEVYINGFSTSLPEDVQFKALKQIKGFENIKMFRPGYAIEYDYFPPTQLQNTLETQLIEHLYFAGQINGTTGYEEAASQGLIAGINAVLKIREAPPFTLKRSDAYIGVLIDDLINKGTEEPYRMFTSRAEYRILLRQDNADLRLTKLGYEIGLASKERFDVVNQKIYNINQLVEELKKLKMNPADINDKLHEIGSSPVREKIDTYQLLKRPELNLEKLMKVNSQLEQTLKPFSREEIEQAEINTIYESYIEKERKLVEKVEHLEHFKIREGFDYRQIKALSIEAMEKLSKIRPATIGQATRISGVSPADISVIMVYLGR